MILSFPDLPEQDVARHWWKIKSVGWRWDFLPDPFFRKGRIPSLPKLRYAFATR